MLAQTVIAGYYYILSSVPHVEDKTWPYVGISPTGLPTGDSQQVSVSVLLCSKGSVPLSFVVL